MSLGEKISLLRKSKGMSQEMLAEQSQLSLRTIQRIESGETSPRPFTLSTIAAALGVSIGELGTHSGQIETEYYALKMINLSTLSVIVAPILHVLVVTLVWRWFNKKHPVHPVAGKIISFQIFWILVTALLAVLIPIIQQVAVHAVAIGHLPPTVVIVYGLMLLVNIGLTIRTAIQLQRNQVDVFPFIPAFF